MKVVILAGGRGSRLSEYTSSIPKPMVKIVGVPILKRIIGIYKKYGFNEFIVASGYKSEIIKSYFKKNKNIKVIFTGKNTDFGKDWYPDVGYGFVITMILYILNPLFTLFAARW